MIAALFWFFVSFIIYVYAGYPALVTLAARLFPAPKPHGTTATPTVTLIIAAYNEALVIEDKLMNSLELDYPREKLQIIVAADGSDDATPDIVRRYAGQGVELSYDPPRRGKASAINRAMQMASGEIVVFSDANNHYAPDVLKKLTTPFLDSHVGAATGAKHIAESHHVAAQRSDPILGTSEGLYWRYESFIKVQETRLGCCTSVAGEILAIRGEFFEPLPENIINDDFYIAMRLMRRGYRIIYMPDAQSSELASTSATDERVRRARIVAGRYQALGMIHELLPFRRPLLVWQIISHKYFRPLVPFAMLGALLTNLLAVALPPRVGVSVWWTLAAPISWMLLLLQVLFYALAFAGQFISFRGRVGKLLYLPTFLLNSNRAALVGLFRYISGSQTNLWQRVPRVKPSKQSGPDSRVSNSRENS
ncbi:MAG: glycosyltransferase family 2 protein [Chloroflexi bacterium]|nr:glycosyltransferase family 2 protein [Chloroflexota bacterium]